jgi:phage recombination protein Bet
MADRCNVDPDKLHQTLKNTVFKGATDDEMLALVVTANVYELNPLLKEMYAFPKKGGGITPMVGVDGWLKIANRQPNYDGMTVEVYGDGKTPTHATCEVFLKDRAHSVKITEYFDECKRGTDPWNQMPRRMLRNKVMIQAIRVAFGIGGIHDEDEAADIAANSEIRETTGRVVTTGNPYVDAPAESAPATEVPAEEAKPAPKPRKKAEPKEEAPEEPVQEAEVLPSRKEMYANLKALIAQAEISPQTAEARIKKAGLIPEGKTLAETTDAELFEIMTAAPSILLPQAEETQTPETEEA